MRSPDVRLRHALRADLPYVAEVWADAFAGDPYLRWIVPDDAAWQGFSREWMTFVATLAFERGHTYVGDGVAVAWIPPDLSLVGPDDVARGRALMASYAGEARADAAVETIVAARGAAMEEPHWTLQYLGVRDRGRGLGAAAVAPMLRVCDEERLPCGLVSTNGRNVPFYERLGFVVDTEIATPGGEATLRPMRRAFAERPSRAGP